jgi:hypothetical protein
MHIPMSFVADEANISEGGKVNVLGIFDRIASPAFPLVYPRMVFVFRLQADAGDGGQGFSVHIRLEDDAGATLFEAGGELAAPLLPPGELFSANHIVTLVNVAFPRPGTYRFLVTVGSLDPHETAFVITSPPPERELN